MIDPKTFAASTLQLLQQDPRRYRSFGPYWYLVKGALKRFYTRENLHLLGNYVDDEVVAAMPEHGSLAEALEAATEWYRNHQAYGLGRAEFETPSGEVVRLQDPDAGGI